MFFLKKIIAKIIFFNLISPSVFSFASIIVNDISHLNPIQVDSVFVPTQVFEIQEKIKKSSGIISIGGGRYSMGGQTATEHALQIDMRKMNNIIFLDEKAKKITVQAGIRWRDIQTAIDQKNLSLKIMQTYSNFTVGGSLSVNAHGRYVNQGPIIHSVESIKIVLADGSLVNCSSSENKELFYGAIGGYGALGVIVEATLYLTDNTKVERSVKEIKLEKYKDYFYSSVKSDSNAVFHNGDFILPEFKKIRAITWVKTLKPLTVKERLIPKDLKYLLQPMTISAISSIPHGSNVRNKLEPKLYSKPKVVWRNYEASYDVAELEPLIRYPNTYVLQEYFIPVKNFEKFVPMMKKIFDDFHVNVINVSVRHALPDTGSLMSWAREEVFSFVIYYKQGLQKQEKDKVARWTKELIDKALSLNGTYYLPYQIHASEDQFMKAYPNYKEFFSLKKKVDPFNRFRNKLLDRYYTPIKLPENSL
ncbi:FAD-binding oxidoreductase [Pigmentibacter sp. JX0631]|uniref:FAD-dependent oxidoreductase n=1 Tax=Pigmentibacter sp. JX0631 TaxID=2976982 RepID=UPI00246834F0|nr:FAD-binding oxidoreductase [Pigmentibacter sp. JX0631]WGL61053.1 FAD-binding oxidoreductase [Pigmentibacter sp. JX0631]